MTTAQWLTYFCVGLIGYVLLMIIVCGIAAAILGIRSEIRFRAYLRRQAGREP